MAKRKRDLESTIASSRSNSKDGSPTKVTKTNGHVDVKVTNPVIQIVTGSYERVLHGLTASISGLNSSKVVVQFADSFLFNAHASAVRCLAISPLPADATSESNGVYLASGGSDERVNVYSLAASPVLENDNIPTMPSLGSNKISEHPGNRELGSLMQHSSNITALHFPTRSKLLAGAEDNTISISRTKDLTAVSTIKAPRPKVQGQPSGDTAPPGMTPAGVNDFAVHPSMKLMISVGKGERSMRLWNLVTGKKAGVLNFERNLLNEVKEGKYSTGEGRKIRWNPDGTEFAVAFERGVVIFGEDSKPKCTLLPQPLTKVHQISYVKLTGSETCLAVSTEDGRVVFFDTSKQDEQEATTVQSARAVAQIGGKSEGSSNRVKDFKLLYPDLDATSQPIILITATSDGSIRLWYISATDLSLEHRKGQTDQIGKVIATQETGSRITCLDAFIMLSAKEIDADLSTADEQTQDEESSDDSSDGD